MATGNGNNNNNPNGDISFSQNVEPKSGVAGWLQNRQTRNEFRDNVWKDNGYLSESIRELEEMNKLYAEMEKFSDRMTKTEQKRFAEQKRIVQQQLNSLNKYKEAQSMSDKEAIDNIKLANKLRLDGLTYYQKQLNILKETDKKHQKDYEEHLRDAAAVYDVILDRTREINGELDEASALLKKTSDKFADSLSTTLKSYGDKLADLSNMFNLQAIANNSMETNARSKAAIMTSVNRQFGFTSNSQFESFKNSLNDTIKDMNKEMGAIFNAEDLKGYMANLAQYNITNTDMAQQQMRSSIIANKYLGVTAETQTQMFKYMKLTNNNEVLNDHNRMIVGILKSQLGVSKEQLDVLSKQTYSDADALAALGVDQATQNRYIKEASVSKSALSSINESWGTSIGNVFNEMIAMPYNEMIEKYSKIFGNDTANIYNQLISGNAIGATNSILTNSHLNTLLASGDTRTQSIIQDVFGIKDIGNLANMSRYFQDSNNQNDLNNKMKQILDNIEETGAKDVESYVEQTQQTTWLEKMSNTLATWFNGIPWQATMGLANIAFGMYIASGAVKLASNGWKLITHNLVPGFKSLFSFFKGSGNIKDVFNTFLGKSSSLVQSTGAIDGQMSLFNSGKSTAGGALGGLATGAAVITLSAVTIAALSAISQKKWNEGETRAQKDVKNDLKNSSDPNTRKWANNNAMVNALAGSETQGRTSGWDKTWNNVAGGFKTWGANWFNGDYVERNKEFWNWMNSSGVFSDDPAVGAQQRLAAYFLFDKAGSLESIPGVTRNDLVQLVKEGYANVLQPQATALVKAGWAPSDRNKNKVTADIDWNSYVSTEGYHKAGKDYIPRDNYRALLHKGEMVLNADEAARYRGMFGIGGESDALYAKGIRGRIVTGLPWVMTAGYGKYPTLNKQHRGLDFGISEGTPVGAAFSGVVDSVTTGWGGGYGNSVYIKGDNGVYYRYAHLSKLNVKAGQQVAAGDTIGLSGNTGNSTGPHLHFQTDKPYGSRNDINPYAYVTSSLFQATGEINMGEDGKTRSTGTASQIAHIPVQTRKFIPKAFAAASEGGIGGAQEIVGSVNGGFDKLINYLDSIREEQTAQRAIISAFAKSRTSESNF